jgi:hypothetical protein
MWFWFEYLEVLKFSNPRESLFIPIQKYNIDHLSVLTLKLSDPHGLCSGIYLVYDAYDGT